MVYHRGRHCPWWASENASHRTSRSSSSGLSSQYDEPTHPYVCLDPLCDCPLKKQGLVQIDREERDRDALQRSRYYDMLVEKGKYSEAECLYRDVSSGRRSDAEQLEYLISKVDLLEAQGKYSEAEAMAWKAWRLRDGDQNLSNDEKSCLRSLCRVLKARKQYKDIEILCRAQYESDRSLNEWALTNGRRMSQAIARQGDIDRARISLSRVWDDCRRYLNDTHELTVDCGCLLLDWLERVIKSTNIEDGVRKDLTRARKDNLECEKQDLLRILWRPPPTTKHRLAVLSAGHKLGETLLQGKKKNAEAEGVLSEVWSFRKQYLGQGHPDSQMTGMKLATALKRHQGREKCERAVEVLAEMWQTRTFGRAPAIDFEHGEMLAHAHFCAKDFNKAEQKYLWCLAQPTKVAVRWRLTYRLGQSILYQDDWRLQEAVNALHMVWEETRLIEPENEWRLKCGLSLAVILGNSPVTQSMALSLAEDVFRMREKAGGVEYLQAGCIYGVLQANTGDRAGAKETLRGIWRYPTKLQDEHQVRIKCGSKYAAFERNRGRPAAAADIEDQIMRERLRLKL